MRAPLPAGEQRSLARFDADDLQLGLQRLERPGNSYRCAGRSQRTTTISTWPSVSVQISRAVVWMWAAVFAGLACWLT